MDKLKMQTPNLADKNYEALSKMFPNAVTETIDENGEVVRAIDADVLRQEISCKVVEGKDERYQFTWPDKKRAVATSNSQITSTLRPIRSESVDFDTTENVYIEGDNLDVLKLLQETYLGKIRVIYIDPPYNTGGDFIYNDDYSESLDEYINESGQVDELGNRLVQNLESNGRFHTDWLNMIYPRIKIARNLLAENGVIFISIDDIELANAQKMCDDIFHANNRVGCVVRVSKTTSFRGNYFAPSKDYILVYAKNISMLPQFQDEVTNDSQFNKIENKGSRKGEHYRDDIAFYLSTLQTRPNQRYFIECPDGELVVPPGTTIPIVQKDGEKILPKEGDGVWRWEASQYLQKKDLIAFKQTKTSPLLNQNGEKAHWNIYTKSYLLDKKEKGNIPRDMFDGFLNRNGSEELKKLGIPFSFPKPSKLIKYLIKITNLSDGDIVLDFFSGSATTADAVMQYNVEKNAKVKYILVQLPEEIEGKMFESYKTLTDVGRERIRRAGECLIEENANIDKGFRTFKIDSTNMKDIYYRPADIDQSQIEMFADNIKEDRTPEDLLFQVMLDLGVLLSSKIEETEIAGKKVFNVADGFLIACFDKDVTDETIKAVANMKPYYAVFRDSSMANDSVATNFDQIFANISPDTIRKVL